MPGDASPGQSAEAERSRYDKETPDLVGEELGDNARIWREYDRVAREEDRERISNWNRGLDNLALFAGLFSAVTTAFIIESQNDTEADYARLTFLVLNASAGGIPFREEPFVIDSSVRAVNCLWISSLLLSLTAALIAIMGKDWIGMYATRPVCNPRQWAEIRTYRLGCVERWYMSGVIASAPVLLHMSLVTPFKSPATQAFRGSLRALFSYLRETLWSGPKGHPVAILQQTTLIIGTLLSHPLPMDLIPLDRAQRRRLRRGDVRIFWNRIFPATGASPGRSWLGRMVIMASSISFSSVAFARALPALFKRAWQEYLYRRQRPRTRPWLSSLHLYLLKIDFSDRWNAVHVQPAPELLALAISRLNEMSPSPETFHSTLVALGDLPIGPKVAPLVSFDIKTRILAEIRHNWPKADLMMLSRYILVDRNISTQPLLYYYQVLTRFEKVAIDPSLRSEQSLFAIAKMKWGARSMLSVHCPDITTQPRGLQYLIPLLEDNEPFDCGGIIILASRYWHHLADDVSFSLEHELRRQMDSQSKEWFNVDVANKFGGQSGLTELLVFLSQSQPTDVAKAARAIIINILDAQYGNQCRKYVRLSSNYGLLDPIV